MERVSQLVGRHRLQHPHLKIVGSTSAHVGPNEEKSLVVPGEKVVSCKRCRGAGYLRVDVPFGHPQFGKPIACECKEDEKKEREKSHLEEMSQIKTLQRFQDADFDSFDVSCPGVKAAYHAATRFACKPKGWLVLSGISGCGKTHLAVAVAKERLEERESVLFQTVADFLDYLRSAFHPQAQETYDQLFARLRETDVLILDDLGAEQSTPWAQEKLFQLLNHRYNAMAPTMITLNKLDALDSRILSRLNDKGLVTHIAMTEAGDYRPLVKPPVENEA